MKRVRNTEWQAGMAVAEDVFGPHGELLIPKGVQIDERTIKTLNHWNITGISVEGEGEDALKAFSSEQIEQTQKEITSRYVTDYKDNPTVNQLIKECVLRSLQKTNAPAPAQAPATPQPPTTPQPPAS